MSDDERTGVRDLTYSQWHRRRQILQYGLTHYQAWALKMIDIDWCEYCAHCGDPLALIEIQVSENDPKPAPVTARLAHLAGVKAWSVSVQIGDGGDISLFKIRQIEPPCPDVQPMLPQVYAYWLFAMRERHGCVPAERSAS